MALRNTLACVALAGGVLVGSGCFQNSEYHFSGEIDGKQLEFSDALLLGNNSLEVTETSGRVVEYVTFGRSLELYLVKITVGNDVSRYWNNSKNPEVHKFFETEQAQFDEYLRKIIEANTKPLVK